MDSSIARDGGEETCEVDESRFLFAKSGGKSPWPFRATVGYFCLKIYYGRTQRPPTYLKISAFNSTKIMMRSKSYFILLHFILLYCFPSYQLFPFTLRYLWFLCFLMEIYLWFFYNSSFIVSKKNQILLYLEKGNMHESWLIIKLHNWYIGLKWRMRLIL